MCIFVAQLERKVLANQITLTILLNDNMEKSNYPVIFVTIQYIFVSNEIFFLCSVFLIVETLIVEIHYVIWQLLYFKFYLYMYLVTVHDSRFVDQRHGQGTWYMSLSKTFNFAFLQSIW